MKRYAIWNKQDIIITPVGEVLTPEEWIARYPVAGVESITVLCAAGEINGAFFGTLGQMVERYEDEGCDFSKCETPEEKLAVIEAFEDAKLEAQAQAQAEAQQKAAEEAATAEMNAASMASIAASLEYQNMMTLDDVEVQ